MVGIFSISIILKIMEFLNRSSTFLISVLLFFKIGFLYGLAYFIIVRGLQALSNLLIIMLMANRNQENQEFGAFQLKLPALMTCSEAIILITSIYYVFPIKS